MGAPKLTPLRNHLVELVGGPLDVPDVAWLELDLALGRQPRLELPRAFDLDVQLGTAIGRKS
jgi:hypothetical protein